MFEANGENKIVKLTKANIPGFPLVYGSKGDINLFLGTKLTYLKFEQTHHSTAWLLEWKKKHGTNMAAGQRSSTGEHPKSILNI